ncbi:MAG TPA: HEAT repeat domain-containing protein [Blastocatellia bacterium]
MRAPLTPACAVFIVALAANIGASSFLPLRQDSEIARLKARLSSGNEEERLDAAVALSAMRGEEAAVVLRAAIDDRSEKVRAAAINGLASMGDDESAPLIAASLREDKSLYVRKEAAYALGHLRSSDAALSLINALRDKNVEVRGAAAVALGELRDLSTIEPLIVALNDKSDFVRAKSARALGRMGRAASQAVAVLINLLSSDEEGEVKRETAQALGLIGDRAALPALREASQSSDPLLSEAAAEAIKMITRGQ